MFGNTVSHKNATHKKQADMANKVIYLSQGHYDGRATWHYLLVNKMKLPLLQREAKLHNTVDLTSYGSIVFSGFGENPPEEVKYYVKKIYGQNAA